MNEKASDVLLIKEKMDLEVKQYRRMELPNLLREELIEQVTLYRMEQARQLLGRSLDSYNSTVGHHRI